MIRIKHTGSLLAAAMTSATLLAAAPAQAANSVSAGQFTVERPTLLSEGFHWFITGDDNRNAKVDVQYRKKGDAAWKTGLPFIRAGGDGETVGNLTGESSFGHYIVPNMLGGSIFNLQPDTDYEAQFKLSDPDGGSATKLVSFHTRKEPMPTPGGHVYNVYPPGWTGPKQQPAFMGLMAAYFMFATSDDHENMYETRVRPGDTILMHAGTYINDQHHYLGGSNPNGLGANFDGTFFLTASGTADKPIVIKAAGDGEVVLDGNGAAVMFNLEAANYNYFEGVTVRNTEVAFLLGVKNIVGASGFTLKHSKLYNVGRAVQTDWNGTKDFYVADNDINGRHDPDHLMAWSGALWQKFPAFPELFGSEYAIKVYGQGNVVAYNHITNFHDGVDFATYGAPDGISQEALTTSKENPDHFPESNDFYGNDISEMGDNCIEMDGTGRNMRVFNNRCFNLAEGAISVEPGYGGPNYWIRNVIYDSFGGAFKFIENSSGIETYNNTVIASGRPSGATNMHFRNNLILSMGDIDPVFSLSSPSNNNSADYDGFRPTPGKTDAFDWNTPDYKTLLDYKDPTVKRSFKTLADFTAATGQEKHGVLVDYDSFVHVVPPNIADPQHVYDPNDYDFRLKPTSPAVDAGLVMPNITDGFAGKAPDLGAIELGDPMPHYGPR